jgi:hypothetical protein
MNDDEMPLSATVVDDVDDVCCVLCALRESIGSIDRSDTRKIDVLVTLSTRSKDTVVGGSTFYTCTIWTEQKKTHIEEINTQISNEDYIYIATAFPISRVRTCADIFCSDLFNDFCPLNDVDLS